MAERGKTAETEKQTSAQNAERDQSSYSRPETGQLAADRSGTGGCGKGSLPAGEMRTAGILIQQYPDPNIKKKGFFGAILQDRRIRCRV